jgi:hypothetical protein
MSSPTNSNPSYSDSEVATPADTQLESPASQGLLDRVFRDREGNIVVFQAPNLPVLVGVAASVLQSLGPSGKLQLTLDILAFGAFFTWAWLELFEGVNYFRRGLGIVSLVGLIGLKVYMMG